MHPRSRFRSGERDRVNNGAYVLICAPACAHVYAAHSDNPFGADAKMIIKRKMRYSDQSSACALAATALRLASDTICIFHSDYLRTVWMRAGFLQFQDARLFRSHQGLLKSTTKYIACTGSHTVAGQWTNKWGKACIRHSSNNLHPSGVSSGIVCLLL